VGEAEKEGEGVVVGEEEMQGEAERERVRETVEQAEGEVERDCEVQVVALGEAPAAYKPMVGDVELPQHGEATLEPNRREARTMAQGKMPAA
jgi:hypothetical protein